LYSGQELLKFNITSNMMRKGIPALKAKGSKVHLSYGIYGLHPLGGGGDYAASEDIVHAQRLVNELFRMFMTGILMVLTFLHRGILKLTLMFLVKVWVSTIMYSKNCAMLSQLRRLYPIQLTGI
jgi:hypothetical protein